jgi:nitric oxide reductase subunit B
VLDGLSRVVLAADDREAQAPRPSTVQPSRPPLVLKGLAARRIWKDGVIRFAFWAINLGLAAMVLISVLPVGLAQTMASVRDGLWHARSAEFLQQDYLQTLRWLRVIGDTIFAVGTLALAWFVIGLKTGWSVREGTDMPAPETAARSPRD